MLGVRVLKEVQGKGSSWFGRVRQSFGFTGRVASLHSARGPIKVIAVLIVLVGVPAAVLAGLEDIPPEHPQIGDMHYALEKGWFTGYPDGTFRPDEPITPEQLVVVFGRFGGPLTRADLATVLRAGHQALRDLEAMETTDVTAPPAWDHCKPICLEVSRWDTRTDEDGVVWNTLWSRFQVGRDCDYLSVRVQILDQEGNEVGGGLTVWEDGVPPGHYVVAEVDMDQGHSPADVQVRWEGNCENT